MNKVLVLPDIHGRRFWKETCKNIDKYTRVIFLGDYFDPYDFENISISDCINNFKEILELKKNNMDKVVLLLGNHDYPYYSADYYNFSTYHCRHSKMYHNEISHLFTENKDCFKLCHVEGDILFTHAGIESGWLYDVVGCDENLDINEICNVINDLQDNIDGQRKLYMVTSKRGGWNTYGSCIWTDIHDIMWDIDIDDDKRKPIHNMKQVFGHTLQAFYDYDNKIVFGKPIEYKNVKMLDTAKSYVLNVDTFNLV